jgi:hypothetical protein
MLHLGVALTTEEADHFAKELNIPTDEDEDDIGHYYELETYLSNACGLKRSGITIHACDSSEHDMVFALVSDYDLRQGLSTPFKKMVETVQKVFGPGGCHVVAGLRDEP